MMTMAQIGKTFRIRVADGRVATAGSGKSIGRRPGLQLWTILHAQALLNGTAEAVRYGPQ